MENQLFVVEFDNGVDRRSTVIEQPDEIFALMYGQREAPGAFSQPWNQVADQRKWKVVVIGPDLKRYEEPVVITMPFVVANSH